MYTRWITRSAFLCLITPGLGFGPLLVMGTDFVLSIAAGVCLEYLSGFRLLGMISLVIAAPVVIGVMRYADKTEKLRTYMTPNVALNNIASVLVAAGFLTG